MDVAKWYTYNTLGLDKVQLQQPSCSLFAIVSGAGSNSGSFFFLLLFWLEWIYMLDVVSWLGILGWILDLYVVILRYVYIRGWGLGCALVAMECASTNRVTARTYCVCKEWPIIEWYICVDWPFFVENRVMQFFVIIRIVIIKIIKFRNASNKQQKTGVWFLRVTFLPMGRYLLSTSIYDKHYHNLI